MATVVTRMCLIVTCTSLVFLLITNVRGVRGAAAWQVGNHLSSIMKAEERKQDVSRWPWGLKGNSLKILFFPLIFEYWKTIALFEASPAFLVIRLRLVCSIGGVILTGGNVLEYWNASKLVRTYQIAVPPHTQAPPQLRRPVADAKRRTKHVHSGTYGYHWAVNSKYRLCCNRRALVQC